MKDNEARDEIRDLKAIYSNQNREMTKHFVKIQDLYDRLINLEQKLEPGVCRKCGGLGSVKTEYGNVQCSCQPQPPVCPLCKGVGKLHAGFPNGYIPCRCQYANMQPLHLCFCPSCGKPWPGEHFKMSTEVGCYCATCGQRKP